MRTTLVIPDSIYRRAEQAARTQGRTLSDLVTEAMAIHLAGNRTVAQSATAPYRIKPVSMGVPQVDVNDHEALLRRTDEGGNSHERAG